MIRMTPEILAEYGVNVLLLIAVAALWRHQMFISNKLTEKYEKALDANTKAMHKHAMVVEADASRIAEQTRAIENQTRQLAALEGIIAGRFQSCAPSSRD